MSYVDTLAMAVAGEALGFESALLAEHYSPSGLPNLYPAGPGAVMAADAWIYLAAIARETHTIHLGTLVSPVTFRHPVVLAKMAATLDHVSNGRAELGIGAGWLESEHQAFGFDLPAPARRVDLVEEQLQIITGLWREASFSHSGRVYRLQEAQFTPKPVQQPRPTVIVGGRITSQRLPRLAARYADEFVVGYPTAETARIVRQRLNAACRAAGRDPAEVRLSAFLPVCVAETQPEVERRLASYRATNPQYVRMMDDLPTWLMGTPPQVRQQAQQLEAAGIDRLMVAVNDKVHREMLPLVADALN